MCFEIHDKVTARQAATKTRFSRLVYGDNQEPVSPPFATLKGRLRRGGAEETQKIKEVTEKNTVSFMASKMT
jgi:hypothetical protein